MVLNRSLSLIFLCHQYPTTAWSLFLRGCSLISWRLVCLVLHSSWCWLMGWPTILAGCIWHAVMMRRRIQLLTSFSWVVLSWGICIDYNVIRNIELIVNIYDLCYPILVTLTLSFASHYHLFLTSWYYSLNMHKVRMISSMGHLKVHLCVICMATWHILITFRSVWIIRGFDML